MIRVDVPSAGGVYPVIVEAGAIGRADALLREVVGEARVFLVTDINVAAAGWAERVGVPAARTIGRHVLPSGEDAKSWSELERLLDAMLRAGLGRSDVVLSVGGAVVSDVAGFAAAVIKRGCAHAIVPTTLLAMVDGAIGGKTGINTAHGKNLIGAFHPPRLVLIDPDTLTTLPERELRAGYAELVKYGAALDPELFAWCEAHGPALLTGDREALQHGIAAAVRAKAAVVAADEHEQGGARLLLNFGHSFAHALESASGYRLLHGEAVAIGMCLSLRLSHALRLCRQSDVQRLERHLAGCGLPTQVPDLPADTLLGFMRQDKKASAGRLRLILARGLGKAFAADDVDEAAIRAVLSP